jgi:hypothetical protein
MIHSPESLKLIKARMGACKTLAAQSRTLGDMRAQHDFMERLDAYADLLQWMLGENELAMEQMAESHGQA